MNLSEFLQLLNRYDERFCSSLRKQLRASRDGDLSELNPRALGEIADFMELADKAGVDGAASLATDIREFLSEDSPT